MSGPSTGYRPGVGVPELLAQIRTACAGDVLSFHSGTKTDAAKLAGYDQVIALLYEAEGRLRTLGLPPSATYLEG